MSTLWHASNVPSALFCDCRVIGACLSTRHDAQRSIYSRVILASCHPIERSTKANPPLSPWSMVASKDALSYIRRWTSWTCSGIRFKHSAIAKQCVQNDSVLVSCKLLHLCSFVVSCAMVKRHNCSQIPYVCNFYVYK